MIGEWIQSGRIVDAIFALMAIEAAALLVRHRAGGDGFSAIGPLAGLASGACLLLALKLALGHGASPGIPLALGGAGLAHFYDLKTRMRVTDQEIKLPGHEQCLPRQRRMIFHRRRFSEVFRR